MVHTEHQPLGGSTADGQPCQLVVAAEATALDTSFQQAEAIGHGEGRFTKVVGVLNIAFSLSCLDSCIETREHNWKEMAFCLQIGFESTEFVYPMFL